jgi:pyrimidine-nucleoside phosphorylase
MFNPVWTIQKKRDGEELDPAEIQEFIKGISNGTVADYQASAFLMAVYFNGMKLAETCALTRAMLESGDHYDLSKVPGVKIDKHSTGGVGDKVSLILAPLAAACGLKVPMMSGRGLGHSGGTLDKLESIEGFNVHLTKSQFEDVLRKVGCAMIGQSEKIAPADKKLYALRDVTATVECIPLIVASILSKKLAEGTEGLVLDVKVGSGAFMKNKEDARLLAKTLTQVAKSMGLKCRSILTNMNQPLGYAVGNSLEVAESVQILSPEKIPFLRNEMGSLNDPGSSDLKELTIQLCSHMLELGGVSKNLAEGRKLAHRKLADGSAWACFKELVKIQGGNVSQIENLEKLPLAPRKVTWKAKKRGYLSKIQTETIGKILVELGGGRKKASDQVDPSVGLIFHRKLGSRVQTGDPLVTVFAADRSGLGDLETLFQDAIEITGARKPVPKLIFEQY